MVDFLWDRGRPRPPVAQKASGRKLFMLRNRAGEGARGPSKSGYQCPNLEFQTDPLPGYHVASSASRGFDISMKWQRSFVSTSAGKAEVPVSTYPRLR